MENNIILQVGVKALLKNGEGKYLMLHRSTVKYQDIKGTWDIVGGRINPGGTLLENLKREIKEETNLELVGQPKLIAAQDIFRKAGHHIVRLTYIAKTQGEVKLDEEENDKCQWLTLEELHELNDVDIYFKELIDNKTITNNL